MKNKNIEKSIIESIKSSNLEGLITDSAEVGLDSLLENGIFKDIPFFGTLAKAYHTASNIKDALFARKVYMFLSSIQETTKSEREKVVNDITRKKGGEIAAGAAILELLDKLDDDHKTKLVGKLYVACAKGYIDVSQLLRATHVISNTYIDDLLELRLIEQDDHYTQEQKSTYVTSGLMITSIKKPAEFTGGQGFSISQLAHRISDQGLEIDYIFSDIAKIIARVCFNANI